MAKNQSGQIECFACKSFKLQLYCIDPRAAEIILHLICQDCGAVQYLRVKGEMITEKPTSIKKQTPNYAG